MGKLMIEVLNTVKNVKFIKIKGPREARPPGIWLKKIALAVEIWGFLKICSEDGNASNWLIHYF